MNTKWLPLLLLAGVAACASGPTQIAYRGGEVIDDPTGIIVKSDDDKKIIAVTSWNDHYALILPYRTDWKFTVERGKRLRGNGGPMNVTLMMERYQITPEDEIKYIRNHLTSDKHPMPPDKTEVLKVNGEPVLRTEINAERIDKAFKGVKHINYYSAKTWKGMLYTLHVSQVVGAEEAKTFNEGPLRAYVTKGFSVEFMRK